MAFLKELVSDSGILGTLLGILGMILGAVYTVAQTRKAWFDGSNSKLNAEKKRIEMEKGIDIAEGDSIKSTASEEERDSRKLVTRSDFWVFIPMMTYCSIRLTQFGVTDPGLKEISSAVFYGFILTMLLIMFLFVIATKLASWWLIDHSSTIVKSLSDSIHETALFQTEMSHKQTELFMKVLKQQITITDAVRDKIDNASDQTDSLETEK